MECSSLCCRKRKGVSNKGYPLFFSTQLPLKRILSPSEDRQELGQEEKNNDLNTLRKEKSREASLIVAGLIATVTFTACFTLPGGFVSTEGQLQGTAVLRENRAF